MKQIEKRLQALESAVIMEGLKPAFLLSTHKSSVEAESKPLELILADNGYTMDDLKGRAQSYILEFVAPDPKFIDM